MLEATRVETVSIIEAADWIGVEVEEAVRLVNEGRLARLGETGPIRILEDEVIRYLVEVGLAYPLSGG